MWYLYLDESGDLGFDFVNKKPSRYFTITILAIQGIDNNRQLINAVKKTLARKLNHKSKKRIVFELKGSATTIEVKHYFFDQVKLIPFSVFSISLNKKKVYDRLSKEKDRVYNYIARLVMAEIKFENAKVQIELVVDRSKDRANISEFNRYIFDQLKSRIDPKVPMNIRHEDSLHYAGLQAVDLFCWGIFRKYEKRDEEWFGIYKEKIRYCEQYL